MAITEKTKIPLGLMMSLMVLGAGLVGNVAVGQFQLNNHERRIEQYANSEREHALRLQRVEDGGAAIKDMLIDLKADLKEMKRDIKTMKDRGN